MTDLLAGQVNMMFDGMGSSAQQIRNGAEPARRHDPDAPSGVPRRRRCRKRAFRATKSRRGTRSGAGRHAEGNHREVADRSREGDEREGRSMTWAAQGADLGGLRRKH